MLDFIKIDDENIVSYDSFFLISSLAVSMR
jgi:hypothetical protein